jgi:RimJ/RimL family protein N-acetyltransferase
VLEDYLTGLADPEVGRLTGTHASFDRAQAEQWLSNRAQQHDRADWAVLRRFDGAFLGEAVLNDLDTDNASVNYRIWLAGPEAYGRGYGTEVTRLVLDYALDTAGLHRVKCGFQLEGRLRDVLLWEGHWHDELVMSVLRTDPRPGISSF